MCFNVTVSTFAAAFAGAFAGAFAMVSLSFANRFGVEHYIVEVRKHAVSGPFSNEVREKSSICCPKASGRFVSNAKKRRNP
jgi:hypothetical protein